MTQNIKKAVGLTSYFISLPATSYLVASIILLGILFGIVINPSKHTEMYKSVLDGLMLLTLPALLSSVAVKLMLRSVPYKRIAGTALGGEIVYSIAYSLGLLLNDVNLFWAQLVILIGSAVVFVFWYVIARFIFILKYRSILFAIVQLLFYLIFLMSTQVLYVSTEPFFDIAAKFYLSSFILLGALVLFFFIINAPMKKSFGLSSTDVLSSFFSQWFYHNKDLENAFEKVGEPAKTLESIFGFKRKNDTVFFVTPYVHYGPFGNLGGSEFSYLLAKELDAKYSSKTFVFHGTVTHDLNPVSSSEITKILDPLYKSIDNANYKKAKISLVSGRSEECMAQVIRINDSAMVSVSRAPEVTEDINFGLGLTMMAEAEKNVKDAMLVDQHNAETGEITSFEPGSQIGYNYINAVKSAFSKKSTSRSLKIGVATSEIEFGVIGKGGIKVAVLSTDPEYVVVLIDSNGVTPVFKEKIENEIKKLGKNLKRNFEVGVFTTDTHQTNVVKGVLNPVKEEETLLISIIEACKEAVSDMQEASFFSDKNWFDINVLGAKQSIEVISTVNSIVAVAKIALPVIFISALLLLIAIATKL